MSNKSSSKISLSTEFPINQLNNIGNLEKLISGGIYKLTIPEGSCGNLMILKNGELAGMQTTSIVGDNGIIATAGLSKIDIGQEFIKPLINLRNFSKIARIINELSDRVGNIELLLHKYRKSELDNIPYVLRDISRKISYAINRDNQHINIISQQISTIKKTAGEYYQMQFDIFREESRKSLESAENDYDDNLIIAFENIRNHEIFKALSILMIVEMFEIVIEGSYSSTMFDFARMHIEDRKTQLELEIEIHYQRVTRNIENRRQDRRQTHASYYWHEENEEQHIKNITRIEKTKQLMLSDPKSEISIFMHNLHIKDMTETFLRAENGLLLIGDEPNIFLPHS